MQSADRLPPVEAAENVAARPGLRERKKQQTRDKIARVALKLFAERGYEQTTLAEIADAADVSTRTIFAYFESKEDILFCDDPAFHEALKEALDTRPNGVTTVDALREFLRGPAFEDQNVKLRKKIVGEVEALRLAERARFGRVEELIAESIAKDLDSGPGDIRPALVAASMTAAFTTMRDRLEAEAGEPLSHEQAMAVLDEVLEFLRGGLDGLRRG
jgi:AcrR family transcriptional regulator